MKLKALIALLLFPLGCFAQSGSPFSNFVYPAQAYTATAQTGAVIQLNGQQVSYASGTITVNATALTTVTFAVMGSSDNGVTYYALPITSVAAGASPAATATATATGLFQVSLVGITHVKFVTSGTFTATGLTLTLTATPNATISRGSSGGAAGAMTLIQSQTVSSAAAAVTFSGIPQNYKNLKLVWVGGSTGNTGVTSQIQLNGVATGYVAQSSSWNVGSSAPIGFGGFSQAGIIVGGSFGEATIFNYVSANATVIGHGGCIGSVSEISGSGGGSSAPVTSFTLTFVNAVNWTSGVFVLYGF